MRGFPAAASYLFSRTFVNRARRLIRRVREPRFAFGLLGAVLYLLLVTTGVPVGEEGPAAAEGLLTLFVLLPVVMSWVLGGDDEVLTFSEAEIQYLFPAPVGRRTLVAYKIVRTGLVSIPFALFSTVVLGYRFSAHPVYFAVGVWLAFVTVDLHVAGASKVRAWLAARGLGGTMRRVVTFAVVAGAGWALVSATVRRIGPMPEEPLPTLQWLQALVQTAPLAWLVAPFRAAPHLAVTVDAASFVHRLPPALVLLGVHVAWLLRVGRFEDGAVRAAAIRSNRRESRGGRARLSGLRIPLPAAGPAWVVLAWKGVVGATRVGLPRVLVLLVAVGIGTASAAATQDGELRSLGALCALLAAVSIAVFGPGYLRTDLRQDIALLDVLRVLPVTGRQVVIGEIVGPWLVLALGEWAMLAVGLGLAASGDAPVGPLLALAGILAIDLPIASLIGLTVENGAAVWFPEVDAIGGLDVAGRRLVTLITTLGVMIGAVLPTAVTLAIASTVRPWVGWPVWPLAALVGAVPVLLATWIAAGWLGARLDRIDPAEVR